MGLDSTEIAAIFASLVLHQLVYHFSTTKHHKPDEARSRIASNVHAIATTIFAALFILLKNFPVHNAGTMILMHDLAPADFAFVRLVLCFSIGYFISDIIVMVNKYKFLTLFN